MLKFRPALVFTASGQGTTPSERCARLRGCPLWLAVGCWGLLWAPHASGEQLVFGSFRSADNASNWALKLSASFGVPIKAVATARPDGVWYRVITADLPLNRIEQIRRRADLDGIRHWRLPDRPADPASANAGSIDASSKTRSPRQQTPRLVPPSPVRPPASQAPAVAPGGAPGATEPPAVFVDGERGQPDSARSIAPVGVAGEPGVWEWDLGLQVRGFARAERAGQERIDTSVSVSGTYYRGWSNDEHSVTFTPFVRVDSADAKRTHGDIRELFYSRVGDDWDVHVGARRVFWGVTEFNHLIDIINQTDLVENIDTEDKLGQPMVQLSLVRDWGLLDVYLLTGFRERTFASSDGRLSLPWRIEDARYESGAQEYRTDFAVRWSHHLGPLEFGVHHFSGTSREPLFVPLAISLQPYYPVIDQTGLDAQAFYGDWVFKLEGFSRSGFGDRYAALNAGLERTFVGVAQTQADLGLVVEYMYDERGEDAFNTPFEDDVALGGRLRMNDLADTEALVGLIYDTQHDSYVFSLEASRRVADTWTLNIEGRIFNTQRRLPAGVPPAVLFDPRFKDAWLQDEDYLQVELKKYF